MTLTLTELADIAGEQCEPHSFAWLQREGIEASAIQAMFDSIERQWNKSDKDAETVTDLCGQAFRLGWECHKSRA